MTSSNSQPRAMHSNQVGGSKGQGTRRFWSVDIFSRRRSSWLIDALLFAVFVAEGVSLFGGLNIPAPEVAMIVLIALSVFRAPRVQNVGMTGYFAGLSLLVLYLFVESEANDVDWTRRLVRIILLGIFVWTVASGRVDVRSGLFGLLSALVVNIPLYYLGIAPDPYAGFLTGYLGDKNIAGLFYALIPILLLAFVTKAWQRWLLIVFAISATFLTGSRTSLGAIACAVLWLLFARRLGLIWRTLLAVGLINLLNFVEDNYAQAWIFEDRSGTDALRARIDAAALSLVNEVPWYGSGLGTAIAKVEDRYFFFHNAYWGLIVEGGWIFLASVLSVFVIVGLNPLRGSSPARFVVAIEAAVIIILTCATRLGEVFITVPAAIVLGCAFAAQSLERSRGVSVQKVLRR